MKMTTTQTTRIEKNENENAIESQKILSHSPVTTMSNTLDGKNVCRNVIDEKNVCRSVIDEKNVCRNYVHSVCRYGDRCKYPHFTPKVCPYFSLNGNCKFEDRCFYSHPKDCIIPKWEEIERSPDFMNPFDSKEEVPCPIHYRIGEWIEVMQVVFYRMNLDDALDDETVWEDKRENGVYVRNAPLPPTDTYFESIRTQDYRNFFIFSFEVFTNDARVSGPFDKKEMEILYPRMFNDWTVFSSHGSQGHFWGFQMAVFTNYFHACITGGDIYPVVLEIVDV